MHGRVRIQLRVSPGAARTAVVGRHGDGWKVRVAAPPEGGRANAELERHLAALLRRRAPGRARRRRREPRDKLIEMDGLTAAEVGRRRTELGSDRAVRPRPRRSALGGGVEAPLGRDDVRDAQAELLVDRDHLAVGDGVAVDQQVDGLPGHPVEGDDRSGAHLERLADGHRRPPELDGELDGDVEHGAEIEGRRALAQRASSAGMTSSVPPTGAAGRFAGSCSDMGGFLLDDDVGEEHLGDLNIGRALQIREDLLLERRALRAVDERAVGQAR